MRMMVTFEQVVDEVEREMLPNYFILSQEGPKSEESFKKRHFSQDSCSDSNKVRF